MGEDQFVSRIDDSVDLATLERLLTLDEFERAYRADGMQDEEFIIFGSTNRTIDQFINSGLESMTALEVR